MTYGKLAMQSRNAGKLYDQCKEFRNAGTPDCRKTHCKGPVIEDQTKISSLDAVAWCRCLISWFFFRNRRNNFKMTLTV